MIETVKAAAEGAAWIWVALSVLGMTVVPISLWLESLKKPQGSKK